MVYLCLVQQQPPTETEELLKRKKKNSQILVTSFFIPMPNPPGQCLPDGSCASQLWLVLTCDPSQFESSRCVDLCSVGSFVMLPGLLSPSPIARGMVANENPFPPLSRLLLIPLCRIIGLFTLE